MKRIKGTVCPGCGGFMKGLPGQAMCAKCARRERNREYMRNYMARGEEPGPQRKCHDCGKPTSDYWCGACRMRRMVRAAQEPQAYVEGDFIYA